MSGRITSTPKRQHHCNAGWRIESDEEMAAREARATDEPLPFSLPPGYRRLIEDHPWADEGAIWTCDDCGRQWKATYPFANVFAPTWVRHRSVKPIRWPWKRL